MGWLLPTPEQVPEILGNRDRLHQKLTQIGRWFRQQSLWPEKRLAARLGVLEELLFGKLVEYRNDDQLDSARTRVWQHLRELLHNRIEASSNWDNKRRFNRLLARIEAHLGIPDPYCRPTRARLELTVACNLRCPMCPQSMWDFERAHAPEYVIDRPQTLYPWLTEFDLTSFGETLLAPEFPRVLASLPEHTHNLLITNGLLVDDQMADRLINSNLTELHISIDSATPETYQCIRGINAYERVIENARRLVRARQKKATSRPELVFNYTLSRKNLEELIPLMEQVPEIGFDTVGVNYLIVWDKSRRDDAIYWVRERTCEVLLAAEQRAAELGIRFIHPPLPRPEDEGADFIPAVCRDPWEFIHFRSDGRITVCCLSADEFVVEPETSWETVWKGAAYQNFRRRVNLPGDGAPPLCRNCVFAKNILPGDPRYHFFDELLTEHLAQEPKTVGETD